MATVCQPLSFKYEGHSKETIVAALCIVHFSDIVFF